MTSFWTTEHGAVCKGSTMPAGATAITEADYNQKMVDRQTSHETAVTAFQVSREESTQTDYDALITAGIPETTAARLTGHTKKGA